VSGVPTVNRVVISVEEGKKDKNAPNTYELLLEGTDLGKALVQIHTLKYSLIVLMLICMRMVRLIYQCS
jgi:hypothetical protein